MEMRRGVLSAWLPEIIEKMFNKMQILHEATELRGLADACAISLQVSIKLHLLPKPECSAQVLT